MVKKSRRFAKKVIWLSVSLALLLGVGLATPVFADNASLYLFPLSGTYVIGNTFSVEVRVDSGGIAVNAAEGTLIFNPDELQVISLSKNKSILSLWTAEPIFSNSTGNIVFSGGTSTGFTGASGTIIVITFKAKTSASAQVSFSSGSVLAADGMGTNILTSMTGGTYNLKPRVFIPEPEAEQEYVPPFTLGVPVAPTIFPPAHCGPEIWCSDDDPVFKWEVPEDVTAVRTLCGRYPRSTPTVLYSPPISEKKLEDVEDGIWYFHCQFKNSYGWGGITHFKFKIDTEPPESFEIEIKGGSKTTNPRPILLFNTTDSLSGIEDYEVRIGDGEGKKITDEEIESNPYQLPVQAPGMHNIVVKASDEAGNYEISMTEVEILPIDAPIITTSPSKLSINDFIALEGLAIPKAKINVYIEDTEGRVFLDHTQSTSRGIWYFTFGHSLSKGNYKAWVEAIDSEGAKSMPSEVIYFSIEKPIFVKIGAMELDYQKTFIIFIGLIVVLGLWFILLRLLLEKKRKKIMEEAEEIKKSLTLKETFERLKTTSDKYSEKLEKIKLKRKLTDKEKQIKKNLEGDLRIAEKFIEKEIKDLLQIIKK